MSTSEDGFDRVKNVVRKKTQSLLDKEDEDRVFSVVEKGHKHRIGKPRDRFGITMQ